LDCGKLLKPGDFAWGFWHVTWGVTGVGWIRGVGCLKQETGDRRQETGDRRAKLHEYTRICWVGGIGSLLSETEKAAPGGLFLFLLYKFRISD
jgi:hypothetical protein